MKKYRDVAFLKREYCEKGKSTYEIADEVNQHPTTIQKWLHRNDIETRPSDQEKDGCFRHNRNGYAIFKTMAGGGGKKQVRIHRLQAVAKYGLGVLKDNIVHHKNGITWDNRFKNIEIMSRSDHQKLHVPEGGVPEIEESVIKRCWPEID